LYKPLFLFPLTWLFRFKCHGYTVIAGQEIISELYENKINIMTEKPYFVVNWFNFNQGSVYFDNNGEPYTVKEIDHINKTVKF